MPYQNNRYKSDKQLFTKFTVHRRVRFEDCDPSGIIFFPNYFRMLNNVVEDWWKHLGIPWTTLISIRRIGTPTFRLEAEFLLPSHFGDILDFHLTVEKLGRTSLTFKHHVTCEEKTRLQVSQILVATSLETHRSIPWPDDVRAAILDFSEQPHTDIPITFG